MYKFTEVLKGYRTWLIDAENEEDAWIKFDNGVATIESEDIENFDIIIQKC